MSEEKLRILARAICEQLRPQGADGWHDRIEVDNEFCLFCGVTVELLRPALREATKAGRESMREEAAQVQDYLDGLTADHASMTKRIAELEVALHDALACHDCREYREMMARGKL